MKSTYFEKNIEYQIEINGEIWNQGEVLEGKLLIRNMDNKDILIESVNLVLAHALKKELKEKNNSPWDIKENIILAKNISVPSKKFENIKWKIQLKTNCPINDKNGGLFLLFGEGDVFLKGGRLDLNIQLHPLIQSFLQTFKTQFSFLEKFRKHKNDWTEVKLIPPESKEFPNLESVFCLVRIKKEILELHYIFKIKGLGRSGQKMKITKKNREVFQKILKEQYLLPGEVPNRNCFREKIDKALDIARPEVIF